MELIVAIIISSLIAGTFATVFYNITTSELKDATRDELDIIAESLLDFYKDLDQFPGDSGAVSTDFLDLERTPTPNSRMDAADTDLQAYRVGLWDGPYIQDKFDDDSYQKDAWQNDYIYDYTYGDDFCVVTSYGQNGASGGGDDIVVRSNAITIKEDKIRRVQDELDVIQIALADYVRATGSAPSDISDLFEWEVLNLHMDESAWAGAAGEVVDNSGMGNSGTANGNAAISASGKVGSCGNFDGSGDHVNLSYSNVILTTQDFTVTAWFKTNLNHPAYGNEGRIVNLHRALPSTALALYVEQDQIALLYHTGSAHVFRKSTQNYYDNQWHFLAVTHDESGTEYNMYYDGVELGPYSDSFVSPLSSYDAQIGSYDVSTRFFNGSIDEVRIYNVALSVEEIYQHYLNPGYPRDYFDLHDYAFKYDAWGNEYVLDSMAVGGNTVYYLYSYGPDRADDSGADDDINPRGL